MIRDSIIVERAINNCGRIKNVGSFTSIRTRMQVKCNVFRLVSPGAYISECFPEIDLL
jgi:hypothetical protein